MNIIDKPVFALLVDPETSGISVVKINPDDPIKSAYEHLGCNWIEPVHRFKGCEDVLFVDVDARLTKPDASAFSIDGQIFLGRGLIIDGQDPEAWTTPRSAAINLLSAIKFIDKGTFPTFGAIQIFDALADGNFRPMNRSDYEAFADAGRGSLIHWDMDGWIVIMSPGEVGQEAISIHAYKYLPEMNPPGDSLGYELVSTGWKKL